MPPKRERAPEGGERTWNDVPVQVPAQYRYVPSRYFGGAGRERGTEGEVSVVGGVVAVRVRELLCSSARRYWGVRVGSRYQGRAKAGA